MNTNNTINGFCFDIITEQNIKINHIDNIKSNIDIHYLIYQIDNTINGKYYIGQHHTNNPLDNYMGSGKQIISAIKKYGVENFVKTILFDFETFEEMNNKEKELLPLSQCYPQNKMSYNLCEGGTTKINKFAGKTDEELRTIRQKIKTTRDNWSEEKRAIVKQHQSNAVHQRYVNMSDEQLKEISKQMSNIMVNTHKNRTSEEQLEINKKISFARKNFSEEKKTEIYLKKKSTIDNWSEEKKKQVHEKRSLSAKNAQQNMSLETRQQSVNKWKQTMNNKTDEEKQKSIQKFLDTMNNKSNEEKRAISKKRSQTLLNRSEEEKQVCINKIKKTRSEWSDEKRKQISKKYSDGLKQHYLNNPNHKLEHSKRMSGKNNPSYGKKWMNNGINRVYVKSDEIQKYLDLGYKFGAKLN